MSAFDPKRTSGAKINASATQPSPGGAILLKVEEIAEVVAKLPPDQLARFRRWFIAFEAGHSDHAEELESTATKLGRLAGRTFAELKKAREETVSKTVIIEAATRLRIAAAQNSF
jgi:hypothetical protein